MEQLVDERQLGEAHHRYRVETGRSVVEHDEFGGDERRAVLFVAVHGRHHVGDGRDALVVDALLEHVEQPGVGQPDRVVAEAFLGDTEVDRYAIGQPRRVERHTDVTDASSGRHARDIGHSQELRGSTIEASAAGPDPDPDRDRCGGDAHEEFLDHVVADDGAVGVHLQNEGLRAVADRSIDRPVDGFDQDRVDEPADLENVDTCHRRRSAGISVGGSAGVRIGVRVALRVDAGTDQSEPGHQREHADR